MTKRLLRLNPRVSRPIWRGSLRREIVVLLAVKAALLYGLWLAFFSQPLLPKMTEGMDPARVAAALVAPPSDPPAAKP
jgi:hypothetical protein